MLSSFSKQLNIMLLSNQNLLTAWHNVQAQLFPPPFDRMRPVSPGRYLLIVGGTTLLFSMIGFFVQADGFLGYDWIHYFSPGLYETFYPPWTTYVQWVTWPGLIGLSCASLVMALYQRYASPLVMAASFLSWPLLWLLFVGQLDGLVLLGLTGLPWLVPLATLKPQISAFAFLANKRWAMLFIIWLGLSMLIWGLWPLEMLNYQAEWESLYEGATQPQNISLWPWTLLLAPLLLWYARGDMDMLMAAGALMTPHIVAYSFVIILPAIARLPQWQALLLVAISWLALSANWLGDPGWYLGQLFPALLWLALYHKRRRLQNNILYNS